MPTRGYSARDPKRWQACMNQARAQMLALGWIERSLKFDEVKRRKAAKLYRLT